MTQLALTINGLEVNTDYSQKDIKNVYLPLLKHFTELQKSLDRRVIIFIAAPPGCGKSTLGSFLEHLSCTEDSLTPLQTVGIDGFQYPSSVLENIIIDEEKGLTLKTLKGIPQSFNLEALTERINDLKTEDVYWPVYSRKLHEPIDNRIHVTRDIVIIEGNYLLYSRDGWEKLSSLCDYSIFINNDYDTLKERLIERKAMGGSDRQESIDHFYQVDEPDIYLVWENRLPADLEIDYDRQNNILQYRINKH